MIDYSDKDMMRAVRWLIYAAGLLGFALGYATGAIAFGLDTLFRVH